jgi:hypothetical protein
MFMPIGDAARAGLCSLLICFCGGCLVLTQELCCNRVNSEQLVETIAWAAASSAGYCSLTVFGQQQGPEHLVLMPTGMAS